MQQSVNGPAMETLCYLKYGNNQLYDLELSYSVLTAKKFSLSSPLRIVLLTTACGVRSDLPVEHVIISDDQLNNWTRGGAYMHEAKIHAVAAALDRYQGKVVLIDTDTYFTADPHFIFERIDANSSVMHANDGLLGEHSYWQTLLKGVPGEVAKYAVLPSSNMYNSGVVGIDFANRHVLADVLALSRALHEIDPVFNIEQFAFTAVLSRHTKLGLCADVVKHYWGFQRRFVHAEVRRRWSNRTEAEFNNLINQRFSVGIPDKPLRHKIHSRIRAALGRQSRTYAFAHLAYLCAQSCNDDILANCWAHVALDALLDARADPRVANSDFKSFAPSGIGKLRWMDDDVRERWLQYWSKAGGTLV